MGSDNIYKNPRGFLHSGRPPEKFPISYRPLVERLRNADSFGEIIGIVFGQRKDLTLLDLGTGDGKFPLSVAQKKEIFGIQNIVAVDIDLKQLESQRVALTNDGVQMRQVDIRAYPQSDERFDIITLNAPVIQTDNTFIDPALALVRGITTRPGFVIIRPTIFDSYDPIIKADVDRDIPMIEYKPLHGLPKATWVNDNEDTTYVLVYPEGLPIDKPPPPPPLPPSTKPFYGRR